MGEAIPTALLGQLGVAGVLAWLFWWTLKRMMDQHDKVLCNHQAQLAKAQEINKCQATEFATVVQNHMVHVGECLVRTEQVTQAHVEEQRRSAEGLTRVLERLDQHLVENARGNAEE